MHRLHILLLVSLGLELVHGSFFHKIKLPKINIGKDLRHLDPSKLFDFTRSLKSVEVQSWSWSSCGGAGDIIKVNNVNIGPDPIRLPGQITVSFDATVSRNISSPVSADLDIHVKKDIIGWIHVPCVDHVGSCSYDDVCPSTPGKDCPPVFKKYGIPCNCPIKEGHYVLPTSTIDVDHVSIPGFLKNGKFKVRAQASISAGQLLCINVEFTLK